MMMKPLRQILAASLACAAFAASASQTADGLIVVKSAHSVADTSSKLVSALEERKLKLFARVDHAAGAASIDKKLRPTEVFIFGNPQGGTPFMECQQTVGIDLPLKALIWQDEAGAVWFGYNDPAWIAKRHKAKKCPVVPNLAKALEGLASASTAP